MRIPPAIARHDLWWRRIAVTAGAVILAACAVRAIVRITDGDFKIHWETGRRFLGGEFLYTNGHDFPYPPILGMLWAPAAALPMTLSKTVCYPLGIFALVVLLWTLWRMITPAFRL